MRSFLTKAILGTTLAASALATAMPAQAQYYHRGGYGYRHHGDSTGAAIAGGVVGLALGAAIASSNNNRYYYRDRGYYSDPYYRPRYNNYYYNDYYYNQPRCRIERRYDEYYGRPYNVRVCY